MKCEHCGSKLAVMCVVETTDNFDSGIIERKVIGRCEDCDADFSWAQRFALQEEVERRPFFHG